MISSRVNRLRNKKDKDPVLLLVSLMKYFGWTVEDVKDLSIPSFFEIMKAVNKLEEKNGKENKGKRPRNSNRV